MNGKKIRIILSALFWIIGYYFIAKRMNNLGALNKENEYFEFIVAYGTITNMIIYYVIAHYLVPKVFNYNIIKKSFVILALFFLLITILECALDTIFLVQYTNYADFLIEIILINFSINIFFLTVACFYGFTIKWIKNEKQKQLLTQENLKSQINFLKSQIQPHFLFNVLNMAYSSAIKSNDNKTADIIMDLSEMMRYMLYESNVKHVSIDKEIDYINSYISLQKKRLNTKLQQTIQFNIINENSKTNKIAPMLLIPFIENAFKHGITNDETAFIKINIHIDNEDTLHLYVANMKSPLKIQSKEIGGIGLENVKQRLKLMYPNQHKLDIISTDETFIVNLNLNLL